MSEKIYAWLLRLYSPQFRAKYGDEALQLFRDRYRDERGFLPRLRLWRDIAADLVISVPREQAAEPHLEGMPLFQTVQGKRLSAGALFAGGVVSLFALGACMMSLDVKYGYLEIIGGCYSGGPTCGSLPAVIFKRDGSAFTPPGFDAAMIELADPAHHGNGVRVADRIFSVTNYTLKDLIEYAYAVEPSQVIGGPSWMDKDAWDLLTRLPAPRPTGDEMRQMTQALLADRFKLKFHREKRDMMDVLAIDAAGKPKLD